MDIANMGASSVLSAGQGLANTGMNYWMAQKSREHSKMDQKEMGNFNYGLEMNKWRDTNYGPQMEEMRKAGLNPSMMMSGGGGGGQGATSQTAGGGQQMAGKVEGGGMDIGTMMAQQSMIELQKSQARKNNVESDNIEGVTRDNIVQDTESKRVGAEKMVSEMGLIGMKTKGEEIANEIAGTESTIKSATMESVISMASYEVESLKRRILKTNQEIEGGKLDNELKRKTMDGNIELLNETIRNIGVEMLLKDSKIGLNEESARKMVAQIEEIANSIRQKDEGLWNQAQGNDIKMHQIRQQVFAALEVADRNNKTKIEASKIGKDASIGSSTIIKEGMVKSSMIGAGSRIIGGVIDNSLKIVGNIINKE